MGNTIKKIVLSLFLFIFYIVFGLIMMFFSLWCMGTTIGYNGIESNENYVKVTALVIVLVSFFGQGFISERYPLVGVSLIALFILTVVCFRWIYLLLSV